MYKRVLAIDIGGSKILTALVELDEDTGVKRGALRGVAGSVLPRKTDKELILGTIVSLIDETLTRSGYQLTDVEAIGVNIPGVADPANCYWVYAPFSGIRDFPIGSELRRRYGLPVYGENDVNACAWAEKVFGACRDATNFLWVTISNGIGGGLVLNGKIYAGSFAGAAEIGHLVIVENGALCGCSHRGCLEAEAAGPAIARRFARLVAERDEWRRFALDNPSAKSIADAARNERNPAALETWRVTGHYLGRATAMAANLINPEKIIFGGGVSAAFDLFEEELERTFRAQAFESVNRSVVLQRTELGYEAGLYGAASLTVFD